MMNDIELKPGERLDDLQRNQYKIIQNPSKFCFGMDAVLLSEFAKVKPGEEALDLGTGTGIIPILLKGKTMGRRFVGLEIQEEVVDMARRSVAYNDLQGKVEIVLGDIREASTLLAPSSFDVVTTNPPYMNDNCGLVNPEDAKAVARHEILCNLEDVARETTKLLKANGRLYMVHRPFRLVEIISTLSRFKIEPKRARFVHPYLDREPGMVLIEAIKGGNSGIRVDKPLIIYKEPNKYTDEVHDIYK